MRKVRSIKAPLMRFSSLRRSVEMSAYFYSSLRFDVSSGKKVFEEMLSRLAIALQDAEQKYPFLESKMGIGRLKDLLEKTETRVQHFEDSPPTRATLGREFGYGLAVEAIDFALAVASVMEEIERKGAKKWDFGEEGPQLQ